MKVLHVYRTYFPDPPGGLHEAMRQIALATQSHGVENRVFALSPHPEPAEICRPEGRIIRARSWMSPASCDIGLATAVRRFREQVDWADVIHYHFPWPFADLLHFLVRPLRPGVMTYHSDVIAKGWLTHLYGPLMRRMLASMDAVVATSPAYTQSSRILRSMVAPDRLRVVPLGITESSCAEAGEAADAIRVEERFGLEPDAYILFIGVLRPYKGLETLVEAAAQTGVRVAIAGTGREQARLRSLIAGIGNISLLGQVTDAEKMALLRGCRALVLPSHLRSEAFGMVLVEAQMSARPMISCEIGTGTSYVNADGVTGMVVPPEDPPALGQAMQTLMNKPALAREYGQAARQRYEALFSGQALGSAYASLYQEVAGTGGQS